MSGMKQKNGTSVYNDSGIEWVGRIPEGWDIKRLKFLTDQISRGISPEYAEDEGVPVINQACIYWDGVRYEHIKNDKRDFQLFDKGKIYEGDLLINSTGTGTLGRAVVFHGLGSYLADSHVTVVRVRNRQLLSKFLYYLLSTDLFQGYIFASAVTGSTNQIELSRDRLAEIPILLPKHEVQKHIVDSLDSRTYFIDQLIKKKKKLIKLLFEKRSVIITRAVTKGIDPDAELVDSGIEWIGKIPKGWSVKKLKHIADISLGKMLQNDDSGQDVNKPYLRAQNIEWEKVNVENVKEMWFSSEELRKHRIMQEDLLVSEGGEVGRTAIWNNELEECYVQNSVNRVSLRQGQPRYVLYAMESLGALNVFNTIVNRVSIAHLTRDKLKEISITLPPPDTQRSIVEFLDSKTSLIDGVIAEIDNSIRLLKEYRSSLITNVVTGRVNI